VKRPMLFPTTAIFSFVITSFTLSSVCAASCDATQGHFFGKPITAEALISWVCNRRARTDIRSPPVVSEVGLSSKRVVI
jgi:hypothetical protein